MAGLRKEDTPGRSRLTVSVKQISTKVNLIRSPSIVGI